MQGHKSAIGSLSETLDFDHGSSSTNPALDQQMCWSNMMNSEQHGVPNFMLPPVHAENHEGKNSSVWNLGEPSSSNRENRCNHDERLQKLNEHQLEPNFSANLNTNQIRNGSSLYMQSSSADLNLNVVGPTEDDCQIVEYPNSYGSNCSSYPFGIASGSGGYLVEENEGGGGSSLDGRRLSNKRKAIESNVGQTSASGSSKQLQHTDSIGWQSVPPRSISSRSVSMSNPLENTSSPSLCPFEHVNPRFGLGLETSQRNLRARRTPSLQDSVPMNLASTGNSFWNFNEPSSTQHSSRIHQVSHSIELNPNNLNLQSQPRVINTPLLPQNTQSLRWNAGPNSRHGTLTQGSLRNNPRHNMELPLYVPSFDLTNLTQNSSGSSRSIHGNGASSSRHGTPSMAPTWAPHQNLSLQYPRRLSDNVRQSLIASDSGGHRPLQFGASSSQEAMLSSANNHHAYRSALLIERLGDGVPRAPNLLRGLPVSGEGRSRLVSEQIRNVLELMSRGEGLRFEDVMILDHSVLLGVADAHDRHRDMRLDVDNMSYEELLALEEQIGNVSTGLDEETIASCLKQRKFLTIEIEAQSEAEPCSICREEYKDGEDLGVFECGHDFHTECIKQWLTVKNLCPICKTTPLPPT